MKVDGKVTGQILCLVLASAAFAQTSGLTQRVPNTTLQMPAAPPAYGYATTNAYGNLFFRDPVAIVSPPGETNRLFIVEQAGLIEVITILATRTPAFYRNIVTRMF